VLIRNNNIVNLINIFAVAFLIYFVILKRFLIIFFEIFIYLRNFFRLCFFKILLLLSHAQIYVVYSLEMRHCQYNFLISLIIFMYFVIYLNLTFWYNLVYEIKSSIVFFESIKQFCRVFINIILFY